MQNISNINKTTIEEAANLILRGGVISFPTETVYALAADSTNNQAVRRIYDLKGRDKQKPLSLLVSDLAAAEKIAILDERAYKLFKNFAPGPITLVLRLRDNTNISPLVHNNTNIIGVRIPDHDLTSKILNAVNRPIIGTSANISNEQSCITAAQVKTCLGDKIDMLIDGGDALIGKSSTVIDVSGPEVKLLRPGVISYEQILALLAGN